MFAYQLIITERDIFLAVVLRLILAGCLTTDGAGLAEAGSAGSANYAVVRLNCLAWA
jgi:hypothetical protein